MRSMEDGVRLIDFKDSRNIRLLRCGGGDLTQTFHRWLYVLLCAVLWLYIQGIESTCCDFGAFRRCLASAIEVVVRD